MLAKSFCCQDFVNQQACNFLPFVLVEDAVMLTEFKYHLIGSLWWMTVLPI